MTALAIIILITLLLYVFLIGRYACHWKNYPEYLPGNQTDTPCFSVIIPFRNEQTKLPGIVHDLSLQDYPAEKAEIILVNDHSDDGSEAIAQDYCTRYSHFRLVHLSDGKLGKKEAIDEGIKIAGHELILTTDADCRAGRHWLSVMASFCHDFSPAMVIGLVVAKTSVKGLFSYFQLLESLSLTGAGAASAIGGKPIYCSGANLCYRKNCYNRIHDPMIKSIASGDDTFLLLQMKNNCRRDIRVLKSRQALITTMDEASLTDFLKQRSRWISKSTHYGDRDILYSAIVVLLTNLAVMATAVLLVAGYLQWLFPVVLITKLLLDGYFLSSLSAFSGIKFWLPGYIVSGIVYPLYLLISIAWAFLFPVIWKGRRYNEQWKRDEGQGRKENSNR
jgi:biofilm PGA synthesis N-glycosyltransferase PgaC